MERLSLWSLVLVLPEAKDDEAPWGVQTVTSHFPLLKKKTKAKTWFCHLCVPVPPCSQLSHPLPKFLRAGQEGPRFMRESMEEASRTEAGG